MNQNKPSLRQLKHTKCFLKVKSPMEVAVTLDLREPEVTQLYKESWNLKQISELNRIYLETRGNLSPFLMLYKLAEAEGMKLEHVQRFGERKWQGKSFPFNELKKFMETIVPFAIYNNHSRALTSTSLNLTPNSAYLKNVIYDNIEARNEKLTPVTNSLIDKTLSAAMDQSVLEGNLANNIISRRIPNGITEEGPDIDSLF